jgi:hypothetical protein
MLQILSAFWDSIRALFGESVDCPHSSDLAGFVAGLDRLFVTA